MVLQAVIPKSYYLIQSPYHTFQLKELTTTVTVTIPEGNYSATSFKTAVQALLIAASPNLWTYSIGYSSLLGKFTYTVTGNSGQPSIICANPSQVYEQLGFEPSSTNVFVANSLVSTNVIKLQSEDSLYLHSDMVTNGDDNVLQEIFVSGSSDYSNIKYQCIDVVACSKEIAFNNSNVFRFHLTSEDDHDINLNGLNIVFSLLMYKKDDTNLMIRDGIKLLAGGK